MGNPDDTKQLHVVMYPWIAYGHLIPYLHLSNKLAERGVRVSFLLPKSAQARLDKDNKYPHLIRFFPVTIPHVDGLPPGAETNSDVPAHLVNHLFHAFDKTKPQVQSYLNDLKPDLVFYDTAYWIPALSRGRIDGFKSVNYTIVHPIAIAFYLTPSRELEKEMDDSVEALIKPPPGFPSPAIRLKRHEAQSFVTPLFSKCGQLTFYDWATTTYREADAVAFRSYREIHGPLCDYIAQEYAKPMSLTGPLLPKAPPEESSLDGEKWVISWLNKFEAGSVVFCGFGSQTTVDKDQFQELVLGFELTGMPFLVAMKPPHGCATVEEALPEGFEERVEGRGMVYGGWVPQLQILQHPSTGCFVSHCGGGAMWESLASDCQIVLIPFTFEQTLGARFMVEELKVAVEVETEESMWISKQSLSNAVKVVMDRGGAVAGELKRNHAKLKALLSSKDTEETYVDNFIRDLQVLLQSY
ncbi:hypothetical protein Tsubulata_008122 [Turnera subulata]|uniref:Glycosyltransferase n=1 Tax=Turnera subulata TaxID=218843 RepID=A0A9Q0G421_9ROSI|nr:hypothetical protein Tsubulata_008122 [Turnera subulata]